MVGAHQPKQSDSSKVSCILATFYQFLGNFCLAEYEQNAKSGTYKSNEGSEWLELRLDVDKVRPETSVFSGHLSMMWACPKVPQSAKSCADTTEEDSGGP